MTEEIQKRLVEHKRWPGWPDRCRVKPTRPRFEEERWARFQKEWHWDDGGGGRLGKDADVYYGFVPDLDDPATLGCLWQMLVEALPEGWEAVMYSTGETAIDVGPTPSSKDTVFVGKLPDALLYVWDHLDSEDARR